MDINGSCLGMFVILRCSKKLADSPFMISWSRTCDPSIKIFFIFQVPTTLSLIKICNMENFHHMDQVGSLS